jgi:hypothetical protein
MSQDLELLLAAGPGKEMTPAEQEAQRRRFAFGIRISKTNGSPATPLIEPLRS